MGALDPRSRCCRRRNLIGEVDFGRRAAGVNWRTGRLLLRGVMRVGDRVRRAFLASAGRDARSSWLLSVLGPFAGRS